MKNFASLQFRFTIYYTSCTLYMYIHVLQGITVFDYVTRPTLLLMAINLSFSVQFVWCMRWTWMWSHTKAYTCNTNDSVHTRKLVSFVVNVLSLEGFFKIFRGCDRPALVYMCYTGVLSNCTSKWIRDAEFCEQGSFANNAQWSEWNCSVSSSSAESSIAIWLTLCIQEAEGTVAVNPLVWSVHVRWQS